jgi:hypothetical protein
VSVDLSAEIVLRWDAPAPENVPLFSEGGITAVWLPQLDDRMTSACAAAGIRVLGPGDVQVLTPEQLDSARDGAAVVVKAGVWTGSTRPVREEMVAGATRRPWVDANGYRIGYLRALYPHRPPVLGYLPDADAGVKPNRPPALSSLQLALIDAWAAGGNYVLSLTPEHRQALLSGQEEARAAWRALGKTARWLRENIALFRQPTLPNITMLVESGEETAEIASLMYRQNASPRLVRADSPPAPDPRRSSVLVTAGIRPPAAAVRARILAHAESGATVVTDATGGGAWWRDQRLKLARDFEDRAFYQLGLGRVVAYKEEIQDPGDFAFDVLDLAGKSRAVRLWDNGSVIGLGTSAPGTGTAALCAVNYGPPMRWELLAQIHGWFAEATLLRPNEEPLKVRVARRGPNSEVELPALGLLAVVQFA